MKAARILIAVVLVAGAFTAIAAGPATGKTFKSTVKIKKVEPNVVSGIVKSKKSSCKRKRTVVVKYLPPGVGSAVGAQTVKKMKLGKDKTNKKGKWKLKGNFFIGQYFAILKAKKLKGSAALLARKEEEVEEEEADEDEDEANIAGGDGCGSDTDTTDE